MVFTSSSLHRLQVDCPVIMTATGVPLPCLDGVSVVKCAEPHSQARSIPASH